MIGVFVYGTLRPGGGSHRLLADVAETVTPAQLDGYALHGRGRPYPYVRRSAGGRVIGDLVQLRPGSEAHTLEMLDAYEGDEYRRERVTVSVAGDRYSAWIYVARPGIDVGAEIPAGDWLADR